MPTAQQGHPFDYEDLPSPMSQSTNLWDYSPSHSPHIEWRFLYICERKWRVQKIPPFPGSFVFFLFVDIFRKVTPFTDQITTCVSQIAIHTHTHTLGKVALDALRNGFFVPLFASFFFCFFFFTPTPFVLCASLAAWTISQERERDWNFATNSLIDDIDHLIDNNNNNRVCNGFGRKARFISLEVNKN